MSLIVLVKQAWSKQDILKSMESPGRKKGKPKGSHIDDFVALRKSVALCPLCVSGFNPRGKRYVTSKRVPFCRGKCDACREWDEVLRLYMPEEFGHVVGASPA